MRDLLQVLQENIGQVVRISKIDGRLTLQRSLSKVIIWQESEIEEELREAQSAIQAIIDKYYGESWGRVSFDFDHLDNRIEEIYVWDDETNIAPESENYFEFLEELEDDLNYITLLVREINIFEREGSSHE